jgi:amino acid permease
MFTKSLEFLGLVLFFVVNVMYSAMIGMDLSSFLSGIIGGNTTGQKWTVLIAFIVMVVLVLNFTSSVLTMMTLGNLYYKFGAKGNPILLSPEYRLELNAIKGLFVSVIVLVTLLTLRLFLSPDQMSYELFEWMRNIPDEISKYGHFILSVILFGLMTTIFHVITPTNHTPIDNITVPSFPEKFKYHFRNLFYVLMGIVLLYFVPFFIGVIGSGFGFGGRLFEKNDVYNRFSGIANLPIPAFDVFVFVMSLIVLGISSKIRNTENTTGTYTQLSNIGIIFSTILFAWLAICTIQQFEKTFQNGVITTISFILLITLVLVNSISISSNDLHNKVFEMLDITNTTESYILSKVMVALLMLFPLGSFIGMVSSYNSAECSGTPNNAAAKDGSGFFTIFSCIFEQMSTGFTLSLIDVFAILKSILIVLAFVFSGFTIDEYHKTIAGTDRYNMYHNKFKFDVVFVFSMVFLMIVLSTSFFNIDNFPKLLGIFVEYLAPVIILIMASYLVYYANDMAKLSKQEVLNDVQKEMKRQRELPDIGDKTAPVATSKTYTGTTQKI